MLGLHHDNYVNDVNMINEIRVCTKGEFRNCNFLYIFHVSLFMADWTIAF